MKKLAHIAIVTDNLDQTIQTYESLLGVKVGQPVSVPDQGIISAYIPLDGVGIEIMQPTDPNGGIQKYLDKKGPGIHHIAIQTENCEEAIAEYQAAGVQLILGSANGQNVAFIHPKSTGGVLVELGE